MSYYVTDGIYYGELDGVRYESCTMEHYIMLHYMNRNRDLVKYFIKTSPTINLQYEHQYGNTILHYAYCN